MSYFVLFQNCRFRNIATDYPPGAEIFFIIGYIFSSQSLLGIKAVFFIVNIITCIAIILLLKQKKLDPRIFIVYAWCPLVLIEFGINGHSDILAVMFLALALLAHTLKKRDSIVGMLIGMAILTRIYPIVIIPAFLKKNHYNMLISIIITVFLGYLPFLLLGHGSVFGFFLTFIGEQGGNGGLFLHVINYIGTILHIPSHAITIIEFIVDILLFIFISALVLIYRSKRFLNTEESVLLLISVVFLVASHIFPWYLPIFLPLLCLLIFPKTETRRTRFFLFFSAVLWYLICASMTDYFPTESLPLFQYNQITQVTLRFGFMMIKLGFLALISIIVVFLYYQSRKEERKDSRYLE